MAEAPQVNPFIVAAELAAGDMIDRDRETADLLGHARAGQPFRLVGSTTLRPDDVPRPRAR